MLDRRVYERIAAGEVIERPANVVKELVENSLDAGATRVSVEVRGGGVDLIRVRDDGSGMDREDALLSIERHATSKLRDLDDLDRLSTLGFRGEALASIASVSKLEIVTRLRGSAVGVRVSVQGGEVLSVDDVGSTEGTAVEVRELFYNLPARRKFMKGPAAEGARVAEVMCALALARTDVHLILVSGGREVLNAPPARELRDRAVAVLGLEVARHLVALPEPPAGAAVRVTGVAGRPQLARPTRSGLFVSVNGRPVDAPVVDEAARAAYGELLFRNRWPTAVLDVRVDPSRVDVNIHPTKREVLFKDAEGVGAAVTAAVGAALASADLVTEPSVRAQAGAGRGRRGEGAAAARAGTAGRQLDLSGGELEEDRLREVADASGLAPEEPAWRDLGTVPAWLGSLRPVGQVLGTYIVCEGEDGLYIVDQHALAERLSYEAIKASAARGRTGGQRMLEPIVLRPTGAQLEALEGRREMLGSLGFSLEVAEDGGVRVLAIPASLGEVRDPEEVGALLQDVLAAEGSSTVDLKEAVVRTMACHMSIRAGERLGPRQVVGLLRGMATSRDPLACVHGRPTVLRLRREELERMFKRDE